MGNINYFKCTIGRGRISTNFNIVQDVVNTIYVGTVPIYYRSQSYNDKQELPKLMTHNTASILFLKLNFYEIQNCLHV